jgi:hypothetical protein
MAGTAHSRNSRKPPARSASLKSDARTRAGDPEPLSTEAQRASALRKEGPQENMRSAIGGRAATRHQHSIKEVTRDDRCWSGAVVPRGTRRRRDVSKPTLASRRRCPDDACLSVSSSRQRNGQVDPKLSLVKSASRRPQTVRRQTVADDRTRCPARQRA